MGWRREGRKAAALDDPAASVMRVRALRGSNIVEVEDENMETTLCMIPAKFSKSMWIKRGNYVLVDGADRQKLLEENAKVTGIITQVLYKDHVKELQSAGRWPKAFALPEASASNDNVDAAQPAPGNPRRDDEEDDEEDDDDDLPALEQNTNRSRGMALYKSSSEEESGEDP